jgi:TonB family protein
MSPAGPRNDKPTTAVVRRPRRGRWLYPLVDASRLPVTGAQHPLQRESARWMILGFCAALGIGGLLLGAWLALFGADETPGRRSREVHIVQREFRPGLRGPLRIMPNLSIESGVDPIQQEGARPGGDQPAQRVREEGPVRQVGLPVEPRPEAAPAGASEGAGNGAGTGTGPTGAVEMNAPAQTNPCFVLESLVRPEYPPGVDETLMRIPLIKVVAAFYVDVSGTVAASYILESEGGTAFDEAVLTAVRAWKFQPVADPECPPLGFWVRLPVSFRGPYELRKAPAPPASSAPADTSRRATSSRTP